MILGLRRKESHGLHVGPSAKCFGGERERKKTAEFKKMFLTRQYFMPAIKRRDKKSCTNLRKNLSTTVNLMLWTQKRKQH